MQLLCVVVAIVAVLCVEGFNPNARYAKSSTAKFLFGTPEPKKDEIKKNDGGGIFGGAANMMEQMKKAQEITKKAEQLNKELMNVLVTGSDPSGQATATYNGLGVPISMKISDGILSQGSDAVSLAASQAMVDGHTKSQQAMMQKMQAMYSDMGITPKA